MTTQAPVRLNELRIFEAEIEDSGLLYVVFPPRRVWRTSIQFGRFWNTLHIYVDSAGNVYNVLVKSRTWDRKIGIGTSFSEVPKEVRKVLESRKEWY